MPAGLSNTIKSLVIQQWLQGRPRNDIAAENGVSSGAVTNIVNQWRHSLGFAGADELRELAVTMKKVGITSAQCALGFRIATVMLRIGVKDDSFESFVLDVYNRCKDIGLSPENISSYLVDLLEFSKTVLPFSKIADYVKEKTNEKGKLEEEIEKLKEQIETLQLQKSDSESLHDIALENERMTSSVLKWYSDLREELRKYGIPIHDISKFAKLVNNIRQYDYDARKVIDKFSDLDGLRLHHQFLQEAIASLENKNRALDQQRSTLELFVNMHNQILSNYQHLETMGFGLKQLQFLWSTVNEIALENNIPVKGAVTKFLSDVERQYDNKLGFESKIESLRYEVNKLNQEQAMLRAGLILLPLVGPKLVKLTQSGVSEQDIVNIAAVFEKYVAGIDRQSFVSELEVYGGLKSAIQKLSKQSDRMRMEVGLLQTQNRDLKTDNQRILSSLINSRNAFDFMHGLVNSLRNEILGLVAISGYIACSIKLQFEYFEKLKSNNGDEFASLSRAYKGGDSVSIQEIKKELIKAIEVMQSKLEVNDRLTDVLSNARLALMDKANN
ncbi:MAG: helix-turn-helix domain-containing protein [Candidatus Nitrosopolaris sp.]